MTSLLMAAGCYGDDGHVQRLDVAGNPLGADRPLIVWRRSLPHGGRWPDPRALLSKLWDRDYDVTMLVMSRDWHAMSLSQVSAGHARDASAALGVIDLAYQEIFRAVRSDVSFELVNYEALTQRPQATVAQLMTRLGLKMPENFYVYDGNARHYGGIETLGRDVETVRANIAEKYGFTVPVSYAADLVAFVDEVSREMVNVS